MKCFFAAMDIFLKITAGGSWWYECEVQLQLRLQYAILLTGP